MHGDADSHANPDTDSSAVTNPDAAGSRAEFVVIAGNGSGNAECWRSTQISQIKDLQRCCIRKGGLVT
jgi:hypothetical protein